MYVYTMCLYISIVVNVLVHDKNRISYDRKYPPPLSQKHKLL